MSRWNDEATSTFLAAASDDLQRQISHGGDVEAITATDAEAAPGRVTLVARIRVMGRTIEVRGTGEGLIDAYAHLRMAVPEPILSVAFERYVTS